MAALTQGADTTVYSDEQAAKLQDMHDQYTSLVDQYQTATEEDKAVIAAQIEALMEDAQAMAESNYNASETAQQLRDVELDQIEAIRENTAALGNAAWSGAYSVQQEKSKGAYGDFWETGYIPGDISYNADLDPSLNRHAFGLDRVPYDGYPALLDEGERVLTAREAREMDQSPSYVGLMASAAREPAPAAPGAAFPSPSPATPLGPAWTRRRWRRPLPTQRCGRSWRDFKDQSKGPPPKPSAAGSVGRGGIPE